MYTILAQANGNDSTAADEAASAPNLTLSDQIVTWLDGTQVFLQEQAVDIVLRVLAAVVVYLVGRWVASAVVNFARRAMERHHVDQMLIRFGGNVLSALLLIGVIMAALDVLGVSMTWLTAILAAAGFAIGMALQGSLSNFAAGLMLVVFKPFRVGDFIQAGGTLGSVYEIHLFTTILNTGDNVRVVVPNKQITDDTITNYSTNSTRRIDLVVGCGYGDDIRAVKAFLTELIESDDRILSDPEPLISVDELGESSINFVVRPWVNAEDYWTIRRELIEKIKLGFDERGFQIPFPSRDVYLHQESGDAATQLA